MMNPLEMVVDVRSRLDAGFLAYDAAHRPRVSVGDQAYPDEALDLALNEAKRHVLNTLATRADDWLPTRQDSVAYPSNTEFVLIEGTASVLSRPLLRMVLVEDMTTSNWPAVVPRIGFSGRVENSPGYAMVGSRGKSPYVYAERGGRLYLLPQRNGAVSLRVSYVPAAEHIDIRSDVPDTQIPEVALDWFLQDAACRAARKYGVPPDMASSRAALEAQAMAALASKHTGPRYGNFTRVDATGY